MTLSLSARLTCRITAVVLVMMAVVTGMVYSADNRLMLTRDL